MKKFYLAALVAMIIQNIIMTFFMVGNTTTHLVAHDWLMFELVSVSISFGIIAPIVAFERKSV